MHKTWRDARWFYHFALASWVLIKAGEYEEGESPEIKLSLSDESVRMLITELDKEGWIKPRLDERLRVEDLKITHRLLDIIDNQFKKAETKENKT